MGKFGCLLKLHILRLLIHWCAIFSVNPFIAQSVLKVESNWDNSLIGSKGEVGFFQLNPKSFPLQINELSNPEVNIRIGVKYLAEMKKTCPIQENFGWLVCYNRGSAGALKVKNYKEDNYYRKVMFYYNQLIGDQNAS